MGERFLAEDAALAPALDKAPSFATGAQFENVALKGVTVSGNNPVSADALASTNIPVPTSISAPTTITASSIRPASTCIPTQPGQPSMVSSSKDNPGWLSRLLVFRDITVNHMVQEEGPVFDTATRFLGENQPQKIGTHLPGGQGPQSP
jgi:hypothetical protein